MKMSQINKQQKCPTIAGISISELFEIEEAENSRIMVHNGFTWAEWNKEAAGLGF